MAKKYFKKCFDLVDRDKKGYVEKVLCVCVCVGGGRGRERERERDEGKVKES